MHLNNSNRLLRLILQIILQRLRLDGYIANKGIMMRLYPSFKMPLRCLTKKFQNTITARVEYTGRWEVSRRFILGH